MAHAGVFLSHFQFGKSVMVEVAQQQARNPVHDVAQALPVINQLPPSWLPPPNIDMPNKIVFPVYYFSAHTPGLSGEGDHGNLWLRLAGYVMLGLGDIALPALFMYV
jgi:hypothetical protein